MTRRPAAIALAIGLSLGSCFEGQALWGERCASDRDCGPALTCGPDGVCGDAACEGFTLTAADLRPRVVLLLDHSESMKRCLDDPTERTACFEPDPPGPSRWDALGGLVRAAVDGLAGAIDFAAIVFPSDGQPELLKQGYACLFDDSSVVPFGPDAAAGVLAAVPPDREREPSGENPVRLAWEAARQLLEGASQVVVPARMIVLVTDNPPNCPEGGADLTINTEKLDASVTDLVAAGAAAGIPTLVLGVSLQDQLAGEVPGDGQIDDVNPTLYMSSLAAAGGVALPAPGYLALGDTSDLPAVTQAILTALGDLTADDDACRVHLAAAPPDPDRVALGLPGRMRRADPTCADDQAWRWLDDSRRALELCQGACAQLHAGTPLRVWTRCS